MIVAKLQDKQAMIKDATVYTIANYIAQGLGIVNSIALRRFMGPAAMGVWGILQVILGYCGYASFGTTKAMARDYPCLRGKGEHEKAEQLKDMTLCFSILMSVIPALIILGYLFVRWEQILPVLRYGLAFYPAILRSGHHAPEVGQKVFRFGAADDLECPGNARRFFSFRLALEYLRAAVGNGAGNFGMFLLCF